MLSGKWEALPSGYMLFDMQIRKKQHASENAVWQVEDITFWLYALRHVGQKRNSMQLRMLSGKWETLPSGYRLFDMQIRKKQHALENAVR